MTLHCACHLPNLDSTPLVPDVAITAEGPCLTSGPHFHLCGRPKGHGGRHWDGEHIGGGVIITAVWGDDT